MPSLPTNNGHLPVCYAYDYTDGTWKGIDGTAQPLLNRGFLYGDGYFDTMAVFAGEIQLFALHRPKCEAAASALSFPFDQHAFDSLQALAEGEGVLRFYAYAPGGVGQTTLFDQAELRAVFTPQPLTATIPSHFVTLAEELVYSQGLPYRHKTLSRLTYVHAQRLLTGTAFTDALLLNEHGRVASLTSSCIVYGLAGQVYAIPSSEGCMAGAARALFLNLTGAPERPLDLNQLPSLSWMLGINSLGPRRVSCIDELALGEPDAEAVETLYQIYPFLKR